MTVNDLHKALSGLIAMKKEELEVLIASTEGMDEYYLITNLSIKTIRNAKLEPQEVIIIEQYYISYSNKKGSTTIESIT